MTKIVGVYVVGMLLFFGILLSELLLCYMQSCSLRTCLHWLLHTQIYQHSLQVCVTIFAFQSRKQMVMYLLRFLGHVFSSMVSVPADVGVYTCMIVMFSGCWYSDGDHPAVAGCAAYHTTRYLFYTMLASPCVHLSLVRRCAKCYGLLPLMFRLLQSTVPFIYDIPSVPV